MTKRDYISEMSKLQTDEERLAWLISLDDSELAELRDWIGRVVRGAESYFEWALGVLRQAASAKTYGELREMLPQVNQIRDTLGGTAAEATIDSKGAVK